MKLPSLATALLFSSLAWAGPVHTTPAKGSSSSAADAFLAGYNSLYVGLSRAAQEAAWRASTDVTEAHEGERTGANTTFAAFAGDQGIIATARALLQNPQRLTPLAIRELGKILLAAAEGPGTNPTLTASRVAAESRQAAAQDGYTYQLDGKSVSANDIDRVLQTSRDLAARRRAWEASKEIGVPLKAGLAQLQKLRNGVAREMKHSSYFALEVADFDMTDAEMMALLDQFIAETKPLYLKLHAWARMTLAARYHQPVPKLIPAHWINNRWSQEWSGIVDSAVNLDPLFAGKTAEWIVKTAEQFYVSMGFPSLPPSFWQRSDLYPVAAGGTRHKNAHASCWHIDLDHDVRSLMSVEPDAQWFATAHHELGHAYYFLSYSIPQVPPILRQGANRAMHEAIGDLAAIAAGQSSYLQALGILPASTKIDQRAQLLNEALESAIPFIAWSAGTISHFEHDLYEHDLPPSEWQSRWWQYAAQFQGVAPPADRPAAGCDACSKTHINDTPAQYYNYALSAVIKYQLHEHICKKILQQDPHQCSYYGHKEVGDFLKSILEQGATRPWRDILREATGEPLSTRAMLDYFAPLDGWLDQQLTGQTIGW